MTERPSSPYKGLNAFDDSELDALLFFGRERENEIVAANLIASRLTVLYGPSGVGKSSLLRAAVARSLRALPEQPLVVVFSRWSEDPAAGLAEAVGEATGSPTANGSALAALESAQDGRDVYVILDQAEEYFLYHADDAGPGSFADALPALLASPVRVNVLISLREDSLAKLDRFTGRIPGLFANTLRLDRLDREAARAAIVRPVARYAELTGETVTVEPLLVERVLDEVGTGAIEPALGGQGAVERSSDGARIEAPYLQVVMQRLWEDEHAKGSGVLRMETLERLGGAQRIVEQHLEGAMAELSLAHKDVAARIFNHLVTPSGTKIAHELSDLADFGRVPVDQLRPVLESLGERRILRSVEEGDTIRYEIFHDVLAEPVLAWRAEHDAEGELRKQKEESDRRHRRLLGVIAVGSVLLAAMGAVTVYALSQRSEAREQAREAKAQRLEAVANGELGRDPELSLLLSLEAARLSRSESAERTLRQALLASRVRTVADVGKPLVAAAADGPNVLTVTEDGEVTIVNARTGRTESRANAGPTVDASFSEDGTAVLTGRDGRVRVVRATGAMEVIRRVSGARGAAISPDASRVAVIGEDDVRLILLRDGRVAYTYAHPGARSAAISSDNRRVLTGGADGTVRVWSGQSGRRVRTLVEHAGHAVAVAYSPDRELVASASTDGIARLWRTSDWGLNSVVSSHVHGLTDVGFSRDGEHLVTAGKDRTAQVSHADTGEYLFSLAGHQDWVVSSAFTGRAGSPIVTTSADGTARLWDAVFQPELEQLTDLDAPVIAVEVAEGDRIRATTADGRGHVIDARTGRQLGAEPGRRRPRRSFGPEGTIATRRGTVAVLRTAGDETILRDHRDRVTTVSFSPDGDLLLTSSIDHDARIWDVETAQGLRVLQHNTAVHDAQFSPDGRWVVTAANRVGLWDASAGDNVLRLQGHVGTASSAAFDPRGRTIVTGGVDGTVRRYACDICGGIDELVALAERRLAATGRELTPEQRERYLG